MIATIENNKLVVRSEIFDLFDGDCVDLSCSQLSSLPDNLTIKGWLDISQN